MASLLDSVRAGFATPGEDPVRILVPSALALLVQATAVAVVWSLTPDRDLAVAAVVGTIAAGPLLVVPLRAMVLGHGSGALGRPGPIWRRIPALAVVQLVQTLLSTILFVVPAGMALMMGIWVTLSGWYTLGVFLALVGALLGSLLSAISRVALAYAPAEVVVSGLGPFQALSVGRPPGPDWLPLLALLALGDVLMGLGALGGGAFALPFAPFSDLAVLHRWSTREITP